MTPDTRRQIDRALSIAFVLLVTAGCGQTQGCGCGEPATYPEDGKLVKQGMQMRLTEEGIDSLEQAVVPLIEQQLGGMGSGLGFCVPADPGGSPAVCHFGTPTPMCDDGSAGCQIDMKIVGIDIQPQDNGPGTPGADPPDALAATVSIGEFDETIPVEIAGAQCLVRAWVDPPETLDVTAELAMPVDGTTSRTSFAYQGSSIDTDSLNLDMMPYMGLWDLIACEGADLLAGGLIKDQLSNFIGPVLEDTVQQFLCVPCDMNGMCPMGSSCDGDTNLCMRSPDQCEPTPIGLEGKMSLADLLGSFGGGNANPIYYSIYPASYADAVDNGLSLGVETGATAEHHQCVPYHDPPADTIVARSTTLEADISPVSMEPYDAGIGVSERFIEHGLWAAYTGGALCLEMDSSAIPQLSAGTLGILLQSLDKITEGDDAPLLLKFAPKQPPTVTLGAGTISEDPETGEPVLEEPLITLEIDDFDIHLYVWAFDRFVRLLTLNTDLRLKLGLTVTPENELLPVLSDLENALTRVEVRNSELLAEDPEFIQDLLPSVISGALPQLAGGLSNPIALPDLMGFQLQIKDLTSIEQNTMLGIFAGLDYAAPGALRASTETQAELVGVDMPIAELADETGRIDWTGYQGSPQDVAPTVQLALSAAAPAGRNGGGAVEYSYRVDGSLWSLYTQTENLRVDHPALLLPGEHVIEVRSRLVDDYRTLDPTPARVEVVIDWIPPVVKDIQKHDMTLAHIRALDHESPPADLRYRYRVDEGTWTSWSVSNAIDLTTYAGQNIDIDAQVRDSAGNVADLSKQIAVGGALAHDGGHGGDETGGCGCATVRDETSRSGHWPGLIALGLLVGIVALRRRRGVELFTGFGAILVLSLALLGCDEQSKTNNIVDACESCPAGTACVDGECVEQPCMDASECGNLTCNDNEAAACIDGNCVCEPQPACGGGCGQDAFCCNETDACIDIPTECALTCDPGFTAEQTAPGSGDSETCEVTEPTCECVELPEVQIGKHGMYTNAAIDPTGRFHVTAYNETFGDLILGIAEAGSTEITWDFVDGVPTDAPVEGKIDGLRGGIREPGANVGKYTDVAIASDGTVHVSYQDVDNEDLKYARGTPNADGRYDWEVHTVDTEGRTGFWTSISLDPNTEAPGIAYGTLEAAGPETAMTRARYAATAAAAPTESDWTLSTLHETDAATACGMPCEEGAFCRTDTVACEMVAADTTCPDGCGDDERCFADGCAPVSTLPTLIGGWPLGTGIHTAQARHADGRAVVVFYDSLEGNLVVARQDMAGGTFAAAEVLAGADPSSGEDTGNVGLWPAVAVDSSGNEHVAYVDWDTKNLVYLAADGSTEIVDDGQRMDAYGFSLNFVGDDASILLHNDTPTIAYQDATGLQLVLAEQDDSGAFVQTVVAGEGRGDNYEGAFGFYADHVVEGDTAWLVNFVVNQQSAPLMQVLLHQQSLQP